MLRLLTAVLIVDESNQIPIRIFHKSFQDFLVDPKRCSTPRFYVDPGKGHWRLAHSCLNLMNKHLTHNICSIRDPTLSNTDAVDSAHVNACIPAELQYACTHWLAHLAQASSGDKDLSTLLQTFCEDHLLHWLEVLSLIQKLEYGLAGLPMAQVWCKVKISYCAHCIMLLMALSSYI
jgi:hypothetical protein